MFLSSSAILFLGVCFPRLSDVPIVLFFAAYRTVLSPTSNVHMKKALHTRLRSPSFGKKYMLVYCLLLWLFAWTVIVVDFLGILSI